MAPTSRRISRAPPAAPWRRARPTKSRLRVERYAYGSPEGPPPAHQPHFGVIVVTCARGEMRASADGLFIYDHNGKRELALPREQVDARP